MKKIVFVCSVFLSLLYAAGYASAQTCEPAINVPNYGTGKPAPVICDIHGSQHVKVVDTDGNIITYLPLATAAAPTNIEGKNARLSEDLSGNLRIASGVYMGGEDLAATGGGSTTGVIVTEKRYLITAAKTADFQVKATPGYVNWIRCIGNDAAATVGTIKIFDSLTETGTELFSWTTVAVALNTQPLYFPIESAAATGIYLGYTTIADIECQVSYR